MNIDMLLLKRLMDQRRILRIHLKDSEVSMDVIFHLVKESLNSSHQQKWFCRQNVGQSRSPRYCSKSQLLTDDVNVTNVTNADDEESDNDIEDDQTSSESGSDEDIA